MAGREHSPYLPSVRYLTWPNAVSALRFPLAAAFIVVETTAARAVILALAALSDWLDGWLARRLDQSSRAGELLDPVADKAFVLAALATFFLTGAIQAWELLILIARDLFAALAFFFARARGWPLHFRARTSGKLVTALQITAILVLLVRPGWSVALVLLVGAAGAYAIVDYTRAGLAALRHPREAL
jgi:CDP-diacylglycerol--glycerol-3-phosphate 3-phosphatidyltransferase